MFVLLASIAIAGVGASVHGFLLGIQSFLLCLGELQGDVALRHSRLGFGGSGVGRVVGIEIGTDGLPTLFDEEMRLLDLVADSLPRHRRIRGLELDDLGILLGGEIFFLFGEFVSGSRGCIGLAGNSLGRTLPVLGLMLRLEVESLKLEDL